MAKKSRRARKKGSRSVSQAAAKPAGAAKTTETEAVELAAEQQEYSYVIADLRQVAILAAAMFALLVGLSFFIS
jgi:hypothetical protein